ncbi:MAG: hypothetical protein WC364_11245 [Eubacteriales bacterium]|jgi:outer membrane biogenesis lipoprotein LolB
MRKIALFILTLLLTALLFGCAAGNNRDQANDEQQTDARDRQAVTGVVEEFGKKSLRCLCSRLLI